MESWWNFIFGCLATYLIYSLTYLFSGTMIEVMGFPVITTFFELTISISTPQFSVPSFLAIVWILLVALAHGLLKFEQDCQIILAKDRIRYTIKLNRTKKIKYFLKPTLTFHWIRLDIPIAANNPTGIL